MNEILVTGGTGVLGRLVVDRLRGAGHEVRVLSRSGRPGTIQGDLLTGAGLEEAVDGVEAIVHCASNPYRKTHQTDVGGTELLLPGTYGTSREDGSVGNRKTGERRTGA